MIYFIILLAAVLAEDYPEITRAIILILAYFLLN